MAVGCLAHEEAAAKAIVVANPYLYGHPGYAYAPFTYSHGVAPVQAYTQTYAPAYTVPAPVAPVVAAPAPVSSQFAAQVSFSKI